MRLEKGLENYWRKGVKTDGQGWGPRHGGLVKKMGVNLMKIKGLRFKGLWKERVRTVSKKVGICRKGGGKFLTRGKMC